MRATIHDPAVLCSLKPAAIIAYLRSRGWKHEDNIGDRGSIWLWNSGSSETDVIIPLGRELGDFALRMAEVVRTIADLEERSELDLIRDMSTASSDLIRLRVPGKDAGNGSLPLDRAVTFVERSRDLMLSAACAAIDRKPHFATRKPQQAVEYLRNIRMGQTEYGSYVLTILSPVTPELRPEQKEFSPPHPASPPYERLVVQTLVAATGALNSAARQAAVDGDMAPFRAAVRDGVSANLCDAIAGMSAVVGNDGLDINVAWSAARTIPQMTSHRVMVEADAIPVIGEAARMFRATSPVEDFVLEGFVIRLNRGQSAPEGDVTVSGYVDGSLRHVLISLGGNDYVDALRAHEERRNIRCVGELVRDGRGFRLQNARQFRIGPDEGTV